MFDNLRKVAINELNKLDTMYANKDEFTAEDAKKYDCLMHALKSHLTAEAMMDAEEYSEENMSGRMGRSPITGRYVSRDSRPDMSYAEGYSRGYSEAMSHTGNMGNSNQMPPYQYPDRYR